MELVAVLIFGVIIAGFTALMLVPVWFAWLMIGVYREPWIPDWVHEATEDFLADRISGELQGEIEKTGVQAGWVKLSAGDDGLTATETKVLRVRRHKCPARPVRERFEDQVHVEVLPAIG